MSGYDVPVFELDPKRSIRKRVDNFAFHFDLIFFRHSGLASSG
jgi:hypothetical protein